MKKYHKAILVLVVIVLGGTIGAGIWRQNESQKPYSFLNDAATQQFSDLGSSKREGKTDCYPIGANKTNCPSVIYVVSKQACSKAAAKLNKTDANSDDCPTVRSSFTYKNKEIKTYVGEGQKGEYWVNVYLEEDL